MDKEEAREKVSAAIRDHLIAAGTLDPEEELISSWALVIHKEKVEDNGFAYYVIVTSSGNMPSHAANGLFFQGLISERRD